MMENWILVVGYDRPHFEAARKGWLRLNVYLYSVDTATEAIDQCPCRKYLAVIASYNVPNITPLIEYMSGTNQIPLVILSQNDSGTKFAESIIRGADTFIIDPDKLIESIKENKDIIDRLAKMPPGNRRALGILTHRDIFMLVDYRKVFVNNQEITRLQKVSLRFCSCYYHRSDGYLPMNRYTYTLMVTIFQLR